MINRIFHVIISLSNLLNELFEDNQTIRAINDIRLAPIMTYCHPPKDHNNDARALPTAPNMKLLTTKKLRFSSS